MIRIFYLDGTWFNVDNDTDATNLINQNAEEFTSEQIINAVGNEHLICNATMFQNENGDWCFKVPQEPTQEEIVKSRIAEIQTAVQNLLDFKAQEKNYDNGFAIASYANSTDTIFHDEANRFIVWRDQCWRECYNILAQFQSGEIEMPTVDYVLERLPNLEWEE